MLRAARPGLTESEIIESSFAQISTSEIIVTLLSATGAALLINLRKYENRARIHLIPNLKVGVFVTLRAPDVITYVYYIDAIIMAIHRINCDNPARAWCFGLSPLIYLPPSPNTIPKK